MINITKYIQFFNYTNLLAWIEIKEQVVYAHPGIYMNLCHIAGETTIDTFIYQMTHKPYACYCSDLFSDVTFEWNEKDKAYRPITLTKYKGII